MSPFVTPAVSRESAGGVAVAISAGTQLKLHSPGAAETTSGSLRAPRAKPERAMVCNRLFRLAFIDVGFTCHPTNAPQKVALID